jgi:transmembrane sensor
LILLQRTSSYQFNNLEKRELVGKFFRNECTAEEAETVVQWLAEDPALLSSFLPEEEWQQPNQNHLSIQIESEIWQQIQHLKNSSEVGVAPALWSKVSKGNRFGRSSKVILRWAAAAAVLVFMVGIWWQNSNKQGNGTGLIVEKKSSVSVDMDTLTNSAERVLVHYLPDGSKVSLYANARIIFPHAFQQNRSLILEGRAQFDVAKDSLHPFSVRSGKISTTALGTVFMVDARASDQVNVQLFEGRVVINSLVNTLQFAATYLEAGEQCMVDLLRSMTKVSKIPNRMSAMALVQPKYRERTYSDESSTADLVFEKETLTNTFKRLEKIFGTTIAFDDVLLKEGNLFTGKFEAGDSLLLILNIIASMNDLEVNMQSTSEKTNTATYILQSKRYEERDRKEIMQPLVLNTTAQEEKTIVAPTELSMVENKKLLEQTAIEINGAAGKMEYEKRPLLEVVKELLKEARIEASMEPEDFSGLLFSGQLPDELTPLQRIQLLCNMNGLEFIKGKEKKYTIKKKK